MMDPKSEHIKEVYARFGLAIYASQVLEHGIVNALVTLDLIPNKRSIARSADEWSMIVDEFMEGHFKKPLGGMIRSLRSVAEVPSDLENQLDEALKLRNHLAHHFFKDRSTNFLSWDGRERMLEEIDKARDTFDLVDERLEKLIEPIRKKAGITDKVLEQHFNEIVKLHGDLG